jgi:glycine cleavage system H protein
MSNNIPSDLKYTNEHCYFRLEGNLATVGVSDYGQQGLDIVTSVDLPEVGQKYNADNAADFFCVIMHPGTLTELSLPVAGTVEVVNQLHCSDGNEDLIKDDPYGDGWLIKIRVDDPNSVKNLLSASQYEEYLKERLKSYEE